MIVIFLEKVNKPSGGKIERLTTIEMDAVPLKAATVVIRGIQYRVVDVVWEVDPPARAHVYVRR